MPGQAARELAGAAQEQEGGGEEGGGGLRSEEGPVPRARLPHQPHGVHRPPQGGLILSKT